jgi:hypothetical protein
LVLRMTAAEIKQMSNRLDVAHTVPRREPHEFLAAPVPARTLAGAALTWLHGIVGSSDSLNAAVRRDLGLPAAPADAMPFAYEIERSRVRV